MEGLDAGEVGVRVELVVDVEGGADFDVFLGEVVAVDEDFADLVGVVGILAVVGVITFVGEAGGAACQEPPSSSSKPATTSVMKSWKPQPMPSVSCSTLASRSANWGYSPASLRRSAASSSSADSMLL